MTTEQAVGTLAGDPAATRSFWDTVFDKTTGELRLARAGRIWDAVTVARRTGATGTGRCVAVVDVGFDQSVAALRHNIHPASRMRQDTVELNDHHGTVVALLVRAVAPDAQLLLLDACGTGPAGRTFDNSSVAESIQEAKAAGADVINLSLQFPTRARIDETGWADVDLLSMVDPPREAFLMQVDAWITHRDIYADARCPTYCPLCNALQHVPDSTVVVAAAGNKFEATCPACLRRAVGTGFERTSTVEVDGVVLMTRGLPKTETVQLRAELVVEEPPGFLGTSFAAPLISGLAALLPTPGDIADMAWVGNALTPLLWLAATHRVAAANVPPAAIDTLYSGLGRFAAAVPKPHRHWEQGPAVGPCAICALVMVDWYDAYTSHLLWRGANKEALDYSRLAATLAPDVASVNGNLGEALRRAAAATSDPEQRREHLRYAEAAYLRAIDRPREPVKEYSEGLTDVRERLGASC